MQDAEDLIIRDAATIAALDERNWYSDPGTNKSPLGYKKGHDKAVAAMEHTALVQSVPCKANFPIANHNSKGVANGKTHLIDLTVGAKGGTVLKIVDAEGHKIKIRIYEAKTCPPKPADDHSQLRGYWDDCILAGFEVTVVAMVYIRPMQGVDFEYVCAQTLDSEPKTLNPEP